MGDLSQILHYPGNDSHPVATGTLLYIQNGLSILRMLPSFHLVLANSVFYSKSHNHLITLALAFPNQNPIHTPKLIHSLHCRLTNIDDNLLVPGPITQG